ncbi:MarR family transcriptional regulator [Streptomyces sp. NPDC086023]|uniref:MarR family transcriptional regulator n=1 Tax=Streptomyces sp. NPDC086023 TaxID=3365746 RepID=UPI0037D97E1B
MASGGPLPKSVLLSLRLTAPLLFTLGAVCAWTAQRHVDYDGIATALCLCVCAAGLFAEDLLQDGYRRARSVLAHVAVHPGVNARQAARAVGVSEKVVTRSLDRLVRDGIVIVGDGAEGRPPRGYRLAPVTSPDSA